MFSSSGKDKSNTTTLSTEEALSCISSGTRLQDFSGLFNPNYIIVSTFNNNSNNSNNNNTNLIDQHQRIKKKRSLPGNPDPDAEVIALSPKTLLATNRFVCEICNKGFQRDQNLQLHRRGHNLPWKLKQRASNNGRDQMKKRAYVCPEPSCVHHHPSRALGDLTGIKKHFCRKHGEKKWKCDKCSKVYAVQSDWKAHTKTCGTREYRCDCGTLFSRKDSFITHRAFCDALAEESERLSAAANYHFSFSDHHSHHSFSSQPSISQTIPSPWDPPPVKPESSPSPHQLPTASALFSPAVPFNLAAAAPAPNYYPAVLGSSSSSSSSCAAATSSAHLSATALLQKAAVVGAQHTQTAGQVAREFLSTWPKGGDHLTRDFLGLTAPDHPHRHPAVDLCVNVKHALNYSTGAEFAAPFHGRGRDPPPRPLGFEFTEAGAAGSAETWSEY